MTTDRTNGPSPRRDWLALLRDAGPNGAAPDSRHAAIWGALLDLRGIRDTIEIAVDKMTAKLDTLANKATLTHAITAGWEPDENGDTARPVSEQVAARDDGRTEAPDLDDLVERARGGLMTLRTLWNSHAVLPGGVLPEGSVAFGASIEFVVDSLEGVLDEIAEVAAATNADRDTACEADPPA